MYYRDDSWGWGSNASKEISLIITGLTGDLSYDDFSISSSNENVIGKKQGNTIVYARVGKDIKIGCVVAVTSSKKIKAINKAKKDYKNM